MKKRHCCDPIVYLTNCRAAAFDAGPVWFTWQRLLLAQLSPQPLPTAAAAGTAAIRHAPLQRAVSDKRRCPLSRDGIILYAIRRRPLCLLLVFGAALGRQAALRLAVGKLLG